MTQYLIPGCTHDCPMLSPHSICSAPGGVCVRAGPTPIPLSVAGEITTRANVDYIQVARDTLKSIGYDNTDYGIDYKGCAVMVCYDKQSNDIAQGVDHAEIVDGVGADEVGHIEVVRVKWPIGPGCEHREVNVTKFGADPVMDSLHGLCVRHIKWIGMDTGAEIGKLRSRTGRGCDNHTTTGEQYRNLPANAGGGARHPCHLPRKAGHQIPMKGCIRRAEIDLKRVGASVATMQ